MGSESPDPEKRVTNWDGFIVFHKIHNFLLCDLRIQISEYVNSYNNSQLENKELSCT